MEGHIWSFADDFRKQYGPRLVAGNGFQDWRKCGGRVLLSLLLYFFLEQSRALWPWLTWSSLCRPGLPPAHRDLPVNSGMFICPFVCGGGRGGKSRPWHLCGRQRTICESPFSLSPAWVPRLDHRLSGLAIAPLPLAVLQA